MALGTNHLYNNAASVAEFIPEIWSDDIIAAYKSNLVMANLVSKINHKGKKGDTIHIPKPTRGSASAKAVATQVTLNQNNSSEVQVSINKHYEYSVIIEDILAVQALNSLRRFHTDDAGYALAKQIDQDLSLLAILSQGGSTTNDWATAVIGSDGSTAYADATDNAAALSDAGIRKIIQTLDDADVPMSQRYLVIPPVERNNMMGLARFTEQAFTGEAGGGNTIRNGRIGNVYGVEVYVSSNLPWLHSNSVTNTVSTTFSSTAPTGSAYVDALGRTIDWATSTPTDATARIAMMFHKDAFVLAEQVGVRSQSQYKQEYLGTLMTSDCIYGVAELRDEAAVAIAVAS